MAAGRLGVASLAAATNTSVYTAPATVFYAEVDISVVNYNTTDAIVEVAIATTATPGVAEYIEKGVTVYANGGVLTREGIKMSPGEIVVVKSSGANVSVRVSGIERSTQFN